MKPERFNKKLDFRKSNLPLNTVKGEVDSQGEVGRVKITAYIRKYYTIWSNMP